ncbi:MAG: ribosome silencing factor [Calditrichia bacterium]
MTSIELAERIAKLAWEKKGQEITLLDLRGLTDVSDFFVIVNGESDIHVKAIFEYVEKELRNEGLHAWHREGFQKLNWVLLDYIDVVLHVFRPQTREFYDLERLWGDAKIIKIEGEDVPDRLIPEE